MLLESPRPLASLRRMTCVFRLTKIFTIVVTNLMSGPVLSVPSSIPQERKFVRLVSLSNSDPQILYCAILYYRIQLPCLSKFNKFKTSFFYRSHVQTVNTIIYAFPTSKFINLDAKCSNFLRQNCGRLYDPTVKVRDKTIE